MEKKIIKYGHEYTLVESDNRSMVPHLPEPCFMGFKGWVLKSVKKVGAPDVPAKPVKLTRTKHG